MPFPFPFFHSRKDTKRHISSKIQVYRKLPSKHKVGASARQERLQAYEARSLPVRTRTERNPARFPKAYVRVKPVADKTLSQISQGPLITAEHVGALLVRFPEKAGFYSCGKLYRGAYSPPLSGIKPPVVGQLTSGWVE